MIERALGEADHLCPDADSPFVEGLDGDLVSLADVAEHVAARDAAIFEQQLACAAGANTQLVFLLANDESRKSTLDDERRDAVIAGVGIGVGEDDEYVRLIGVGDPQLAPAEYEAVACLRGARRQGERIAARSSLREGIGPNSTGGKPAADTVASRDADAQLEQRVDDQRVLHVDQDGHRGVHARQCFHSQNRMKESGAGTALSFRALRCP